MKDALLTAFEPWLLIRAGSLARALPSERRGRVRQLASAARARASLARDAREPELLPAALSLAKEALALSISALLAARGDLGSRALTPSAAFHALTELPELARTHSDELTEFMLSEDPAHADGLSVESLRRLQRELEALLGDVGLHYEPRAPRAIVLQRGVRLAALLTALLALAAAFAALGNRP